MDQYIRNYHVQHRNHIKSALYNEDTKKYRTSIHKKYNVSYYQDKTNILQGDKNAILYWKHLNSLQDNFYDFQEELTKQFFRLSLPQLYHGEEWRYNEKQILSMYGYDDKVYKYQLYEAARKEGKTFIAAAHVAALMLSVPPRTDTFIINLVSLSLKNATDILSKVFSIMNSMNYDRTHIKVVHQVETIKVEFYDKKVRHIGTSIVEPKQSGGVSI